MAPERGTCCQRHQGTVRRADAGRRDRAGRADGPGSVRLHESRRPPLDDWEGQHPRDMDARRYERGAPGGPHRAVGASGGLARRARCAWASAADASWPTPRCRSAGATVHDHAAALRGEQFRPRWNPAAVLAPADAGAARRGSRPAARSESLGRVGEPLRAACSSSARSPWAVRSQPGRWPRWPLAAPRPAEAPWAPGAEPAAAAGAADPGPGLPGRAAARRPAGRRRCGRRLAELAAAAQQQLAPRRPRAHRRRRHSAPWRRPAGAPVLAAPPRRQQRRPPLASDAHTREGVLGAAGDLRAADLRPRGGAACPARRTACGGQGPSLPGGTAAAVGGPLDALTGAAPPRVASAQRGGQRWSQDPGVAGDHSHRQRR
mmetsp:Transcript_29799/g.93090  ORF Transcript_29799/g.93090 Transcript_29799/m.93090 type:complete len:376 (-) Transcript_29799:229-1356(-)